MGIPTALFHVPQGKLRSHADREVAELAARQHGVVARWQLLRLGLGPGAIDDRIRRGLLHRVHRGVYAVGHSRVTPRGRQMAAVLAIGADAVLSHRDGADIWGIRRTSRTRVEVTVPRNVRSRRAIQVHCTPLPPDEVTVVDGIPVTIVPRTLIDLAAVLDQRALERAVHEAEVQRLWNPLSIADLLARRPHGRGAAAMRRVLAALGDGIALTRSELEELFLAFIEEYGLRRPEVNATVELPGRLIEADFVWRDVKLIVEVDGMAVHHTARSFESDRERDRLLQVAGWRVVRVTRRQLGDDRPALAADLRALTALVPAA